MRGEKGEVKSDWRGSHSLAHWELGINQITLLDTRVAPATRCRCPERAGS